MAETATKKLPLIWMIAAAVVILGIGFVMYMLWRKVGSVDIEATVGKKAAQRLQEDYMKLQASLSERDSKIALLEKQLTTQQARLDMLMNNRPRAGRSSSKKNCEGDSCTIDIHTNSE